MDNPDSRATLVFIAAQQILAGMMANHGTQPHGKLSLTSGLVDKAVNLADQLVSTVESRHGKLV